MTRYQVDTLWIYGEFHVSRLPHDDSRARCKNIEEKNLINFRNQHTTAQAQQRKAERREKVLNRLIFCHKTFHIFQSSCDGGRLNCSGGGGATSGEPQDEKDSEKKNCGKNDIK